MFKQSQTINKHGTSKKKSILIDVGADKEDFYNERQSFNLPHLNAEAQKKLFVNFIISTLLLSPRSVKFVAIFARPHRKYNFVWINYIRFRQEIT